MTLTISARQIQYLEGSTVGGFHRRLLNYVRKRLPEETDPLDDAAILERIAESQRRAAAYDITSEAGVAQWVCLTFMAGPEFDAIPEVRACLSLPDGDATPEDRLKNLVEELADDGSSN